MKMELTPRTMVRGFLVATFCLVSSLANAGQCGGAGPDLKQPLLCSHTFDFDGTCGMPKLPGQDWTTVVVAVGAWEKVPIRILRASADAILMGEGPTIWGRIFAGNSFNADLMTPEKSGGASAAAGAALVVPLHTEANFPEDDGMQFPAGLSMQRAHLDVHLYCSPKGAGYAGSLSVWYKLDP